MRTKRDFYNQVNGVVKEGLKSLQNLSDQLDKVNKDISSGKYSPEYIREKLLPEKDSLRRQISDVRSRANKEAQRICDEYTDELRAQDDLDPSFLTEDVKLLQAGVKLTQRDIKAMLNRNADNHTMTQVILRYCKENNIDAGGVHYVGNKPIIDNVAVVPHTVEVALRWSDNQSTVYERLMGEGSDFESAFSD